MGKNKTSVEDLVAVALSGAGHSFERAAEAVALALYPEDEDARKRFGLIVQSGVVEPTE